MIRHFEVKWFCRSVLTPLRLVFELPKRGQGTQIQNVCLLTREGLLVHSRLLLLNLMGKMYLVIRSPLFPPFPNEGLDTLKLTKLVAWFG